MLSSSLLQCQRRDSTSEAHVLYSALTDSGETVLPPNLLLSDQTSIGQKHLWNQVKSGRLRCGEIEDLELVFLSIKAHLLCTQEISQHCTSVQKSVVLWLIDREQGSMPVTPQWSKCNEAERESSKACTD